MESSSDDSFLWTDTSSDSCDDKMSASKQHSDTEKQHNTMKTSNEHDDMTLCETKNNIKVKKEKTSSDDSKQTTIKIEPKYEHDGRKKRKKNKGNDYDMNDTKTESLLSDHDDGFLNSKVKQEGRSPSVKHVLEKTHVDNKRGTKELQSSTNSSSLINCREIDDTIDDLNQVQQDSEGSTRKSKKKKKLKEKYKDHDNYNDSHINLEDKFTAEETVVDLGKKHHHDTVGDVRNQKLQQIGTFSQNNTLQEDSEEASCDEISAIKGDDDDNHSLHTTLLTNKSNQKEVDSIRNLELDGYGSPNMDDQTITKLTQKKHRSPKITDRIRFEDESDIESDHQPSSIQSGLVSKTLSKAKHYLKKKIELKSLTQFLSNGRALTKDDEIWVLKCPKEIDVSDFKDANLKLEGKSKLKLNGQSFDSVVKSDEGQSMITVLTTGDNKYQIKNLPLSGHITLKRRIPKPHFLESNVMVNDQTNFIPLPETKCRHPLFGSNYKKALKVPSIIAERLLTIDSQQCSEVMERRKKRELKKSKKISMEVYPDIDTEVTELSLKTESELTAEIRKKKKKRKKSEYEEAPKKKRFKHDPESAEAWESEKAIEENLFNF